MPGRKKKRSIVPRREEKERSHAGREERRSAAQFAGRGRG
jgi:hypothetical protein